MATVKVGGRPSVEVSGGPKIEDILATSGALHVHNVTDEPGQDDTLDRTWGGGKCLYNVATADEAIKASAGVYYGYIITVATATATIEIRDSTSAGGGTVIDVIPIGTVAGTQKVLSTGITCSNGIYCDFGASATGTVVMLYI